MIRASFQRERDFRGKRRCRFYRATLTAATMQTQTFYFHAHQIMSLQCYSLGGPAFFSPALVPAVAANKMAANSTTFAMVGSNLPFAQKRKQ